MNSNKSNDSRKVDEFLENLDHPLKPLIRTLRETILRANENLTEHIKWNAPSFRFDGDDRITLKLHPPKSIQIVFHRGTGKNPPLPDKLISETSGMLKWAANDRAVATFTSVDEALSKTPQLVAIVNDWLAADQKNAAEN